MMTIDFLIGAVRASRDLHPQVKTELEEILREVGKQKQKGSDFNKELRLEVFKSGITYKEIAREMKVTNVWLSRVMSRKMTPEMERRINDAIDTIKRKKTEAMA